MSIMNNKIKLSIFFSLVVIAFVLSSFVFPPLSGANLFLALAGWACLFSGIWELLLYKDKQAPKSEKIKPY